MKPFNLEEYLKNPSRKVVTRNGRNARIICTDAINSDYPIITLIEMGDKESVTSHTKDGKCFVGKESYYDLFFEPEKHEGWINIYPEFKNYIYKSEKDAKDVAAPGVIATIRVEWEE